ncbi:STAS/SEC14 domain-containing protein [Altibacter sp. HG106]|uniref:STAS/SEC14 domain-containing protein n=1 Tax=Altibacter sp. HG106 TaxID=3023937 RepID=UPI002350CADE|nr:STAS/SEC14 domain-containing protein [Altibacter sp. HG106]MDC7994101.1 STAS/SEC14 domain-containing protein [Altibacter sp. HG106]
MIQLLNSEKDNLISAKISGKISKNEVEKIHSLIHEVLKENNKVDFYFEMEDFDGYTLKGFWEDIKVDSAHISDYGKMAFVGEKKWQEWAAKATDFFTSSEVKYFDLKDKELARTWIAS